jgi:trimeric autotransporter adhesin
LLQVFAKMLVHNTFLILALSCGLLNAALVQERNNSNQSEAPPSPASTLIDSKCSLAVANINSNLLTATVTSAGAVSNKHRGGNQAGASGVAAASVASSDTASAVAASGAASSASAATTAAAAADASPSAAVEAGGAGDASANSAAASTTNSGGNKAASGGGNKAAASLTLDANAVQTGSQQNGLAQAEAGQSASDT